MWSLDQVESSHITIKSNMPKPFQRFLYSIRRHARGRKKWKEIALPIFFPRNELFYMHTRAVHINESLWETEMADLLNSRMQTHNVKQRHKHKHIKLVRANKKPALSRLCAQRTSSTRCLGLSRTEIKATTVTIILYSALTDIFLVHIPSACMQIEICAYVHRCASHCRILGHLVWGVRLYTI